jgi:hypothetical protein
MMFYNSKIKGKYNKQREAMMADSSDPNKIRQGAVALKANITKSLYKKEMEDIKKSVKLE